MLRCVVTAFRLFQNERGCPEISFLDALQGVTPGVDAWTAGSVRNVLNHRFKKYFRYVLIGVGWILYFNGFLIRPANSTQYRFQMVGGTTVTCKCEDMHGICIFVTPDNFPLILLQKMTAVHPGLQIWRYACYLHICDSWQFPFEFTTENECFAFRHALALGSRTHHISSQQQYPPH